MQVDEKWLQNQILEDTLAVFRTGCDEKNFMILEMLPTTVEVLQKELKTKGVKSIHTRVNDLEKCGLLIRERGTGVVKPSGMTEPFVKIITEVTKQVECFVPRYLKKHR